MLEHRCHRNARAQGSVTPTDLREALAARLERGSSRQSLRPLSCAWELLASRALARPLCVPRGVFTVTVGGATLGGSGKTRVAIATARALAEQGLQTALIGHAYRARPQRARVVHPSDSVASVGDEALVCARLLGTTCRVVVGPTRQLAVNFAASLVPHVDALVIDGPLQIAPVRASLALLAVDARVPWGAGRTPPAGDLRASRDALLRYADMVVPVEATPESVRIDGKSFPLDALGAHLSGARLGLFTALARPSRLEHALRAAGLPIQLVLRAADHGPVRKPLACRIRQAPIDLWLATEKCALHLAPFVHAESIAHIDGTYTLPRDVEERLANAKAAASLDRLISKALLSLHNGHLLPQLPSLVGRT